MNSMRSGWGRVSLERLEKPPPSPSSLKMSRTQSMPGHNTSIDFDSLEFSPPQSPSFAGASRQRRGGTVRWPGTHKVDKLPPPPGRMRLLICNWPGHFCSESLITVPAGSEPVMPPYQMVVCCDLRARKNDLRQKSAFLVAYDAERLRKTGAGMGIEPLEASNSWLARDCVVSDMVPIKKLFGEVPITLNPPETADGDVLVLLRVVTISDLSDMQDWRPIGDAVVVKVEPRVTREDKKEMRRLREDLEATESVLEETDAALDAAHEEHLASVEARAEMRSALEQWQFETAECQKNIAELQDSLKNANSELEESEDVNTKKAAALRMRSALDTSLRRDLVLSEEDAQRKKKSLDMTWMEVKASRDSHKRTRAQLVATKQRALESREAHKNTQAELESSRLKVQSLRQAKQQAATAIKFQSAVSTSKAQELSAAEALAETRQASLESEEARAEALDNTVASLRNELQQAQRDLEASRLGEEEEAAKANIEMSDMRKEAEVSKEAEGMAEKRAIDEASAAAAANARATEADNNAADAERRATSATAVADEAEKRAVESERRATEAETETAAAKAEAREAREEAAVAEAAAAEAIARAAERTPTSPFPSGSTEWPLITAPPLMKGTKSLPATRDATPTTSSPTSPTSAVAARSSGRPVGARAGRVSRSKTTNVESRNLPD